MTQWLLEHPGTSVYTQQHTHATVDRTGTVVITPATPPKPRMDLLSPIVLQQMAQLLTTGSDKHGVAGWRTMNADWSLWYAKILRHLTEHMKGVDKDPETGASHAVAAMCNLMFLVEYQHYGLGKDDRYKGEK